MKQTWRNLLFAHFAVDPDELRRLIPPYLEIDTFGDSAYVGLVLFEMVNVRLNGLPAAPGISYFPEFNVRTYVHDGAGSPGVWFFSLDARNRLAVAIARKFFNLPYHAAAMQFSRNGQTLTYDSQRENAEGSCHATRDISGNAFRATPGTLDYFLLERYLFHTTNRSGLPMVGRVHHKPYEVCPVNSFEINETLTLAAGISPRPYSMLHFSAGVNVSAFPIAKF